MKLALWGAAFALTFSAMAAHGQDAPLVVTSIHEVKGSTKQALCGAARDWMALSFKDSKAVVRVYDEERGKVIGKGNMKVQGWGSSTHTVEFTMSIDCKDDRLRAIYSDYMLAYQGNSYPLKEDSLNKLQTKSAEMTRAFDADLGKQLKTAQGSDW
jgi:hypothetical protein